MARIMVNIKIKVIILSAVYVTSIGEKKHLYLIFESVYDGLESYEHKGRCSY
jgi:hypothetical protein